jgi:hypothetical protein
VTYDDLLDAIDNAERDVHELNNELREYPEDSSEWNGVLGDLSDAEDELYYLQRRLETEDFEPCRIGEE